MLDVASAGRGAGEVSKEEILSCYDLKTAQYTIECPLVIGALLSDAEEETIAALKRYANALGVAYQLRDDLVGVSVELGEKSGVSDFEQGRQTFLLVTTLDRVGKSSREWMSSLFGCGELSESDTAQLLRLYRESGAVADVEAQIESLRADALNAARSIGQVSGLLSGLVEQLVPSG